MGARMLGIAGRICMLRYWIIIVRIFSLCASFFHLVVFIHDIVQSYSLNRRARTVLSDTSLYLAYVPSSLLSSYEPTSFPTLTLVPLTTQPLPLEYLRLASFDASPESRKEKAHSSTSESVSYPTTYPSPSFLNSSATPLISSRRSCMNLGSKKCERTSLPTFTPSGGER